MKIYALKYKAILAIISLFLLFVDLFLILFYGFEGQLLIFLYIMIGIVPVCGIYAICTNQFIPAVEVDYVAKTITTIAVANELYKHDKNPDNQSDLFHFDEIAKCEIDNKRMIITLNCGQIKTLLLGAFTKKQIFIIYNEVRKIITTEK